MVADSMAEVTDSVKVCPLLTCLRLILRRTAGPPPKGEQAGGFFLKSKARLFNGG